MCETIARDSDQQRISRLLDKLSHLEEVSKELEHRLCIFNTSLFGFPDPSVSALETARVSEGTDILSIVLRTTEEIAETLHDISIVIDKMTKEIPQEEGEK